MKIRVKLLLMGSVLLLAACSSPPNQTNCPPTPINLEWYKVEGDNGGAYLPERSFKNLQLYLLDLKQCATVPQAFKPPSKSDGMRALVKHSVAKANAALEPDIYQTYITPAFVPP